MERLERCGFKVMGLVFAMVWLQIGSFSSSHQLGKSPDGVHRVTNPYSDDGRKIYFISDYPHLMKTVRNAWASKNRKLWVSSQFVLISGPTYVYPTVL